jgi:hypothetical protein
LVVVQLLAAVPGHVHPVPLIDTSVSPDGTASVTITGPLVGTALAVFDTVTVYAAPFCPCAKLPVWLFHILSTGALGRIVVLSLMLLPADPPPDTDTEFNRGVAAFDATFTVTAIGG